MASTGDILGGGLSALLGPGYVLGVAVVVAAGFLVAGRQQRVQVLLGAISLLLLITSLGARAGLRPMAVFPSLLALGPTLLFAEVYRQRKSAPLWVGAATGLVTAALVVLWRVDRFGPVLSSLRGPWQSDPSRSDLALYHFATALGLALLYFVAAELGRLFTRRQLREVTWVVWILMLVMILTQRVAVLNELFLLKWPSIRVG